MFFFSIFILHRNKDVLVVFLFICILAYKSLFYQTNIHTPLKPHISICLKRLVEVCFSTSKTIAIQMNVVK